MPNAVLLRLATTGARATLCLCAALMMALLLAAGPAAAKPIIGAQCSAAQYLKADKCIKKQENDLMNNVKNPRFVACLADGSVLCCRKSSTGPGYNCESVTRAGPWDDGTTPAPGNATNVPAPSGPFGEVPGAGTNAPATNGPAGGWSSGVFNGGFLHKAQ